jgi:NhaP-type Na+/H+ or K+/H+ antiporter
MEALHGPINVGLGLLLGVVGGTVVSQAKLWNASWARSVACALVGLSFAFGCNLFHYTGGGALASLVTTCVAARNWQQQARAKADAQVEEPDKEPETAFDEDPAHWAHDVEHDLAIVWANLAQPLLFCVIGCALNFRELDAGVIPSSIVVVGFGVCMRCPVAFFAVMGAGLSKKERAFVGLAWIPKATVQAALGGIPLSLVRTTMHHDDPQYKQYEEWGMSILTTAVFSILITAPIGLLVIQNLGHRWLTYDGPPAPPAKAETKEENVDPKEAIKTAKAKLASIDRIVSLEDLELCGF